MLGDIYDNHWYIIILYDMNYTCSHFLYVIWKISSELLPSNTAARKSLLESLRWVKDNVLILCSEKNSDFALKLIRWYHERRSVPRMPFTLPLDQWHFPEIIIIVGKRERVWRGKIQSWEKVFVRGLVKFVLADAYHFCLNLPETFSQPRTRTFSQLCITLDVLNFKWASCWDFALLQ